MVCLMTNPTKKVLPFPRPAEEPLAATTFLQVGQDRFAIHWEIEKLPPARPFVVREGKGSSGGGKDREMIA
jgi:hypothetical protein